MVFRIRLQQQQQLAQFCRLSLYPSAAASGNNASLPKSLNGFGGVMFVRPATTIFSVLQQQRSQCAVAKFTFGTDCRFLSTNTDPQATTTILLDNERVDCKKRPQQYTRWAWSKYYRMLVEFSLRFGHGNPPRSYDFRLYTWTQKQLVAYENYQRGEPSTMSPERIELLQKIGFQLVSRAEKHWNMQYERLVEYKKEHGHCLVPRSVTPLGPWVHTQRKEISEVENGKATKIMTPQRLQRLKELGIDCPGGEIRWMEKYKRLKQFHREHGNCMVPDHYPADQALANWVVNQRTNYKKLGIGGPPYSSYYMTKERIELLEQLGFEWSASKAKWMLQFEELREELKGKGWKDMVKERSRCVPWVWYQRSSYQKWVQGERSSMTEKKEALLDSLEIPWK